MLDPGGGEYQRRSGRAPMVCTLQFTTCHPVDNIGSQSRLEPMVLLAKNSENINLKPELYF